MKGRTAMANPDWKPSPNFHLHEAEQIARDNGVEEPVGPIHIAPEIAEAYANPAPEPVHLNNALHYAQQAAAEAEGQKLDEMCTWWLETAQSDLTSTLRKYNEYGDTSLCDLGYEMAELMGWKRPDRDEAQLLGIYYFMLGKMARWKTAILKGDIPSEDTFLDLTCYAMIARRITHSGGWPNAKES